MVTLLHSAGVHTSDRRRKCRPAGLDERGPWVVLLLDDKGAEWALIAEGLSLEEARDLTFDARSDSELLLASALGGAAMTWLLYRIVWLVFTVAVVGWMFWPAWVLRRRIRRTDYEDLSEAHRRRSQRRVH